jgi:uncharacterized protein YfaS (alpha-2-macroglobulin family)
MRHKLLCAVLLCVLCLASWAYSAFDSADFASQKPLKIIRITPDGEDVPPGRQIVIQFNRPVVPLGRMERTAEEIPIEITPTCNCEWRWLNTGALACQLGDKDALRPATKYHMIIRPGIQAEDGSTIATAHKHNFITERPRIRYANFSTWRAPGLPIIRITCNQPVSKDSVKNHLYMVLKNKQSEIYKLKVEPDPHDYQKPRYVPLPGEGYFLDFGEQEPEKSDDDLKRKGRKEARRVWLVAPKKELPLDTSVELKIEPGLVSSLGPEKGITSRVVVAFDTFPEFKFLGVQGRTIRGETVLIKPELNISSGIFSPFEPIKITPDTVTFDLDILPILKFPVFHSRTEGDTAERSKQDEDMEPPVRLNPLSFVALVFSSPVVNEEIKEHVVLTPDLAGGREDYDPWENVGSYSHLHSPHRRGRSYAVSFPELLKAFQQYHVQSKKGKLKDEFGRPLINPIDLTFFTDHRNAKAYLIHYPAVLEKQVDTHVPLVLTNVEAFTLKYNKLTSEGYRTGLTFNKKVPELIDVEFYFPLGVREAMQGKSGAVVGTYYAKPSEILSYRPKLFSSFFVQITPFQVHVKLGHFNSMLWVTDLSTGKAVQDAAVTICKEDKSYLGCNSVLGQTVTDKTGFAVFKGAVGLGLDVEQIFRRWDHDTGLRIRIKKGSDIALLPLNSDFSAGWGHMRSVHGHIRAWGTTAQGIYKAGDTIQYKIYVRDHDNNKFIRAPRKGYKLEIIDPTGKIVHEVAQITLSEFGTYHGEYAVPKTAAVGWYRFKLSAGFTEYYEWHPMRVLVSDFTPSPFRVTNELNGELFHQDDKVEVTSYAKLHAGGPYTNAPTRITARLKSRYFYSKHRLAKGFRFTSYEHDTRTTQMVFETKEMLNDKGELTSKFTLPDKGVLYGSLMVESAVQDDRGKYVATSTSADYFGRDRYVGLKNTRWVYEKGKPAHVNYLVVNESGEPVAGTKVTLKVAHQVTKASRVKGAGNAYLTHYTDEWVDVLAKKATSNIKPGTLEFIPTDPGYYRITATIKDTKGRSHSTQIGAWVVGTGRVIWRLPDNNTFEIIPEEEEFQVGDTARFLLKNPFPGATALITIERYGIMKHWTQVLEGSTPIIEFPVEPDFVPGFYLSVIVTSPRVDKPLGDGNVDLGKPNFRMGYVTVPVKDPYKEIIITVTPEQEVYKPKDKVRVALHARPRHVDRQEPIELAVAVLDEAVFDLLLQGRDAYDPYKGFYKLDGLDLQNYSLLTRLVGRQKFEKKGADTGGGGGPDISLRSVFKFISYWNPSLQTDPEGKATIEFEVPDNLTGWRVFAMAVTPTDRMGLSDEGFKVNRPTEIRPVMPNQVTEGDSFQAGFSVMNRTDKPRELLVTLNVSGPVDEAKTSPIHEEHINLPPYKRTTVFMPIKTEKHGQLTFTVTAGDALDADGLKHTMPVHKRRSLETAATYGTTIRDRVTESVLFPKEMYTDVGSVSVVAAPTVIGNVEGAFRYMRDYPYICWEQILSKGVMAAHYQNLKDYIPEEITWKGSDTLPKKTLAMAADYQAPNGGMVYFIPLNQYVSPYLSAYTALAFNWLRSSGYEIPQQVEKKLHDYLDNVLRRDVVPTFYTKGMSSTVRAVALAALAEHGRVSRADLKRYQPHVPFMSLFGKAHYLQAAMKIEGAESIVREVATSILSHSSQTGGKFFFNEELDDSFKRILATPLRANAAILAAFTELGEKQYGAELVGDVPFKLVRSITQSRGNRAHWENTQENMFCMNALIEYSRIYEHESPNMTVRAFMDAQLFGNTVFDDVRDEPVTFEKPITEADPGRKATIEIERTGTGRLYYAARVTFAPLVEHATRTNAGIDIRREYSVERKGKWILLQSPMEIKRGELVRVDIFLSLPTVRNFVVVDDPVPGGLEPVSRDLATTSVVDAEKGSFKAAGGSWWFQFSDWQSYNVSRWCFYHKELRHDSVRFYSDYLPAGNYHLSYTAQAIAVGEFVEMPVHAEEMYDPDVFGKGIPGTLRVSEE